jgi:selenocysteine lyase/cysteine desulfurase
VTATAATSAAFRAQFPHLRDTVYLASCSLSARSTAMDAAMAAMLDAMHHGLAWAAFEATLEQARDRFARLIGAAPEQVAVLPNATVAAYQVASGLIWWQGPRLLTCTAEFPGIAHVWAAQQPRGAEIVHVGQPSQAVTEADYLSVLDDRVELVSVPAVTYRDGIRLRVDRIAAAAHAAGAKVVVDAYQAVGVEPVDVDAWDCDWLIAGPAKYLCGLPGVVFLYARDPILPRNPRLTGWQAQRDPFSLQLDWHPDARRLQTGTPAVPALYAATAGLDLIASLDLRAARQHVVDLLDYAAARLTDDAETLSSPAAPDQRGAHIGIVDADPDALAASLAEERIIVAPRHGVVRLSTHYFNNRSDVDAAVAAIQRYRAIHPPARSNRTIPSPA